MQIAFHRTVCAVLFLVMIAAAPIFAQLPNPKVNRNLIKNTENAQSQPTNSTPQRQNLAEKKDKNPIPSKLVGTKQVERWTYIAPSAETRAKRFAGNVIGPLTLLGVALSAGSAHAADIPQEWENDFKGYARRFGSVFAENAIEQTITYGLDETLRVDSNFYRKGRGTPLGARFANAFISPFTARTRDGGRVPGIPRFFGIYTSRIVARETWYPKRYSYKDGIRDATISYGFYVLTDLFREFIFSGEKREK